MAITRLESVTYGVENLEECARFIEDFGLECVEKGTQRASFRTPVNQFVHLVAADEPGLPAGLETGPTVREVIWGVDSDATLDTLNDELSRDRPVSANAGMLRTHDVTGFAIGFTREQPATMEGVAPKAANLMHDVQRWNDAFAPYGRAKPLRLIHVTLDIPAEGRDEAMNFYLQRLRFKATDEVKTMGTFMQCEGDVEHHNLLLCHRTNRPGINHIAFEVRDFDEVVEGGNHMVSKGWKESRRLGRHNLGSNIFRMFHAPCGGRFEYASDMDRMSKDFKTRVWETSPPHNLWMVTTSDDERH
jgi:catechol 2,3-dioxygenase-like lactoylglutathione lyase family enzyme